MKKKIRYINNMMVQLILDVFEENVEQSCVKHIYVNDTKYINYEYDGSRGYFYIVNADMENLRTTMDTYKINS